MNKTIQTLLFILSFTIILPQAIHAQCTAVPVKEAIVNGDFEAGTAGYTTGLTYKVPGCAGGCWSSENIYTVGTHPNDLCDNCANMSATKDHTTGTGNAMYIDGPNDAGKLLWSQTVNITQLQTYYFSAWVAVIHPDQPAQLQFYVDGAPLGAVFDFAAKTVGTWYQIYATYPNTTNTSVTLSLVSQKAFASVTGNDFVIDDISFINGCQNTTVGAVVPDLGPDQNLCGTAGTITLNAGITNLGNYNWYEGTTTPQIALVQSSGTSFTNPTIASGSSVTINKAGTYRVCYDNGAGTCAASSTIVITKDMLVDVPNATLNCYPPSTTTLTATPTPTAGPKTYAWSVPAGMASPGNSATANADRAGTYTVTVSNSTVAGCTATDNATVTLNNNMTVNMADAVLCSPITATLDAVLNGAHMSYAWAVPAGVAAPGNSRTATATKAGTYTVTATTTSSAGWSCTATDNAIITSTLPPVPTLEYCDGGGTAVNLTVGDGHSYSWYTDAAKTNLIGTGTSVAWTPAGGTTGNQTLYIVNAETTPIGSAGPNASSFSEFGTGTYSTTFNAQKALKLTSVSVKSAGWSCCGSVTINLKNSSNVVIGTATGTFTATNQVISPTLNFNIPAGNGYVLEVTSSSVPIGKNGWMATPTLYSIAGAFNITSYSAGNCEGYIGNFQLEESAACDPLAVVVTPKTCCTVPTVSVVNANSPCAGSSLNLTATAAAVAPATTVSYSWAGPSSYTSATQNPTRASATTAMSGNYTVTITDDLLCKTTSTIAVTVNAIPTAAITGTTTICAGSSTTLTAGGGTTYAWDNAATTTTRSVTPASTTTYTITATSSGCTDTEKVTVTVNALPTAAITGTSPICAGSSSILTASGGTTYNWDNSTSAVNRTVTPASTATYTVTATSNGCTDTEKITITVNALPTAAITGTSPICAGSSSILTASGGTSYAWDNAATGANRTVTPASTATYTVTATSNGCTDTEKITITVNALPTASIAGTSPICAGSSSILTASGGTTYNWDNSTSLANRTVTPASTATYTVTATSNGCTDTETIVITVNALPTAAISGTSPICAGSSSILTASGGTTYNWDNSTSLVNRTVTPASTTTYTVTATTNGCTDTEKITITVNPLPTAAINGTTPICVGSSSVLTASGGTTYNWDNSTSLVNRTVTPASTATYTITATTNGCTDTETFVVTVNTLPTAAIAGTSPICAGSSSILTASGGTTYNWDNSTSTVNRTVTPASTATYTVTATTNGCTDTETITITVNPLPTAAIAGTSPICAGSSSILTASGGTTYNWDNATSAVNRTVTPATTTTYTITATTNGCTDTEKITITVNPLPTAAIAGTSSICVGASASITASGGTTYNWDNATSLAIRSVTPGSTTNYTVTATSNGCTDTETFTVTVNPLPTVSVGIDRSVCKTDAANLTASHTATVNNYLWSKDAQTSLTSTSTQTTAGTLINTAIATDANHTYTVSITDDKGCTATDDVVITYQAQCKPTVDILADNPICIGDSTTLNITITSQKPLTSATFNDGSGAVALVYAGAGPIYTASKLVVPTIMTTYTVEATDNTSSVGSGSIVITVNNSPTVTIAGVSACPSTAATLSALGGGTGAVYTWNEGTSGASLSKSLVNTTTYTVSVTDANGCTDTETGVITIKALPTANITGTATICAGQSSSITAGGGTTYSWDDASATAIRTVTPLTTSTYTVTATTNSCTDTETYVVTVNQLPTVTATANTPCAGDALNITAGGSLTSYNWSGPPTWTDNIQNPSRVSADATMAGAYQVTYTDGNSCSNTASVTVTVNALPTPVATANSPCVGATLNLTSTSFVSYSWAGPVAYASTNQNPTINNAATTMSGVYTVTVTDAKSCSNTADVNVTINTLPTVSAGIDRIVCKTEAANLVATTTATVNTYLWSKDASTSLTTTNTQTTGGTLINNVISADENHTYAVSITDVNGCTATDDVVITYQAQCKPTIDLIAATPLCIGDTTTLQITISSQKPLTSATFDNGSGPVALIYAGAGPTYTASKLLQPTVTTTYTIEATDNTGSAGTGSIVVTVNNLPTVTVVDDDACPGTSATLSASGAGAGAVYTWDEGTSGATLTKSLIASTTYTVSATDANGCTDTETGIITINAVPTVSAGADFFICKTDAAALTAISSTATGYTWANDAQTAMTSISTAITSGSLLVTAIANDAPHLYTVTVSDVNGCTASDEIQVTYQAQCKPVVQIVGDPKQILCIGESTILKATVNSQKALKSVEWIVGGVSTPATYTGSGPDYTLDDYPITPNTTTTYTVKAIDVTDSEGQSDIIITVNPLPTATVADVTVCPGNNINLTATGAGTGSYVWSPSGNSAIVTASNVLANTTYVVTVTDANGCSDTEDGVISLNAVPNVSAGTPMAGCKDNALTLSPTQDATWTYSWASSPASSIVTATSSTPSVSYLTPGTPATDVIVTYTVTVSDVNGCTNSDDVAITYEYSCRPYVYLKSDDTEICAGETTTVWAETTSEKAIATLTWSNIAFDPLPPLTPGQGPKHSITPNADVTYYITITDVEGRSNTSEITISVNPLPIADAGTDKTICAGDNTTLAVSNAGANGIQQSVWLDNNTGLPFTNTSVAPAITTTYTALITDSKGCKDIDDVIVNVNQLPTPNAGVDQTICPETSTTLTATGGQTYAWSTGETSATINIAAETSTKTYKLTVYDSNNCQNTDEVIVNRHAAAQPDAGVNTSICLTQASATLTASNTSGAATYLWSNGKTTASIIESPATAGTYPYQVTATTTNGCTATDEVTLTVNALPTADLGNLKEICYRDQTTLSDVNASMKKYQWSNLTATTQQVNVSPLTTTLYTITITDNNNCTATDTVTVQVNPQPVVSIAALADACVSTASTPLTGETPAGGIFFGNYVNSSTGTFSPSGATQGTHTISYRYTNNKGCSDTATQTIKVLPLPVVNMQDQSVCEGGSATLSAGPSSSQSYLWNDGSTLSSRTETPDTTTTYSVVATAGGCTAQGDVTVTVNPIPTVDFTSDSYVGCQPFAPTLTDNSTPAGSLFVWDFGDDTDSTMLKNKVKHRYKSAGIYTVSLTVTTPAGCTATHVKYDTIRVLPLPVADFSFNPTTPTNTDPLVEFTDLSEGAVTKWYWNFNDKGNADSTTSGEQHPSHSFSRPGTYKVQLKVISGTNCVDSVNYNVYVKADHTLFMPNAFTPDGDGINEDVYPQGTGFDMETIEFYVFSRWGEEIYKSIGYAKSWDGTKLGKGEILPEGVYAWLVILTDLEGVEFKYTGAIALLH